MSKPIIHAISAAKRYGGGAEDYIEIEQWMDSSKAFLPTNLHRVFWHNSAAIFYLERIFGIDWKALGELKQKYHLPDSFEKDLLEFMQHCRERGVTIRNSDNRLVSVRDIAERHIMEDFNQRFIPTPQDYLEGTPHPTWLNSGLGPDRPSSVKHIENIKTID